MIFKKHGGQIFYKSIKMYCERSHSHFVGGCCIGNLLLLQSSQKAKKNVTDGFISTVLTRVGLPGEGDKSLRIR